MPQAISILTDTNTKTIIKANGVKSETGETLVNVNNLQNSSSDSQVSISDLHYEIQGTGIVEVFYDNDMGKKITLTGRGVYPKPNDALLGYAKGNINITSDANVNKYNIIIECQKRKGFN